MISLGSCARGLSAIVLFLWCTADLAWAAEETRWLALVASDPDLSSAVRKFHSLGGQEGGLDLVNSSDCKNLRPEVFLVTAGIRQSKEEARDAVATWRTKGTKDAYVRVCKVAPDSRLALHIPLLDRSIFQRPADTVNWGYQDALARTKRISNSLVAVIRPRYEPIAEDVREGLRISLSVLLKPDGKIVPLETDCIDPELTARENVVAVNCVNETAADHLLHVTRVYKIPTGQLIIERERCRSPRLLFTKLSCQEEKFDKEGNLHLVTKDYPL